MKSYYVDSICNGKDTLIYSISHFHYSNPKSNICAVWVVALKSRKRHKIKVKPFHTNTYLQNLFIFHFSKYCSAWSPTFAKVSKGTTERYMATLWNIYIKNPTLSMQITQNFKHYTEITALASSTFPCSMGLGDVADIIWYK